MPLLSHITLLSIPVVSTDKTKLLQYIQSCLEDDISFTIFTPNPEILVKAWQDKDLAEILKKNKVNIPDGVGISLFTGIPAIKGRVLMMDILSLTDKHNKKVVIWGSTSDGIQNIIKRIQSEYPNSMLKGIAAPNYTDQSVPVTEEDRKKHEECLESIKTYKPDIVFVALGAPKQEYWVDEQKKRFPTVSFMTVGGAFDTYAGIKKSPPKLMEQYGLEWLFRLILEPVRIGRIISAVIVFPILVILDIVRQRLSLTRLK